MKLFTIELNGRRTLAAEHKTQIIDLPAAYAAMAGLRPPDSPDSRRSLPADLLTFLRIGDPAWAAALEAVAFMGKRPALPVGIRAAYLFDEVKLLAPLGRPGKILCLDPEPAIVRRKDNDHQRQATSVLPKFASAIAGPGDRILVPSGAGPLHCRPELAAMIGKKLKQISPENASGAIAGFTILHNLFVMGSDSNEKPSIIEANFDGACPIGPALVTPDEVAKSKALGFRIYLNGALRLDGTVDGCQERIAAVLSELSSHLTFDPGDMISVAVAASFSVGTPGVIRTELEGIGMLENEIDRRPSPGFQLQ